MVIATDERALELYVAGDTVADERPPSVTEILKLKKEMGTKFEKFHENCEKVDTYYHLRNNVPTAQGHDPIKPATIRAIIKDATDHIDVTNIAIDVPEMPRSKARAERLKKFYLGAWLQIPVSVRRKAAHHAVRYGKGFIKIMFDGELWPDSPNKEDYGVEGVGGNVILIDESGYKEALRDWVDRRSISFPIRVMNVNPKRAIWDDSRSGMKWFIEFYDRQVADIRSRYPQWTPRKKDTENATWMEYWDDTWYAYLVDEEIVEGPFKHGYGFMSYQDISPDTDDDDGPIEDRYQSLAWPAINEYDAVARAMTMYQSILRQFAWRGFDFKGPQGAVKQAMAEYEPFGLNYIPSSVEVEPSPTANPPPEILSLVDLLNSDIEAATLPSVVRGQRPKGVSAGFPISVLAGIGRLKLGPYADAMSEAIQEANKKFAKLVENKIRDKITVHARSEVHNFDQAITPDDIKGYYENKVTLKAEAPEEREREALLAIRLYQAFQPFFPASEALKRSGIANPLETMLEGMAESILAQGLLPQQIEQALQALSTNFQQSGTGFGNNTGNQFLPGQSQLQRVGEGGIQQGRSASQAGRPSVFPQGQGDLDILGSLLGAAPGGAQGMPSGQTVR